MKKREDILAWLAEGAELSGEPIPGQSLVEIAGDSRVLIENHLGIREYTRERICVRLKLGLVTICGERLELGKVSREQLIIRGLIQGVHLQRGERR